MSILQKDLNVELPWNWERYDIKTCYMGCGEETDEFYRRMCDLVRRFGHDLYYTRGLSHKIIKSVFYKHFDKKFKLRKIRKMSIDADWIHKFHVFYEGHKNMKFILYIRPAKRTGLEPYI